MDTEFQKLIELLKNKSEQLTFKEFAIETKKKVESVPTQYIDAAIIYFSEKANHQGLIPIGANLKEVIDFLLLIAKEVKPKTIFNPNCSIGTTLTYFVDELSPEYALGIDRVYENISLSELLFSDRNIEWRSADILEPVTISFDFILSFLPWGQKPNKQLYDILGKTVEINDRQEYLSLLEYSSCLTENGLGCFLVPQGFALTKSKPKSVFNNLHRFGLTIDAAFSIPVTCNPYNTTIPSYLILIKKGKEDEIFIGELSENEQINKEIFKNYSNRKQGKEFRLGKYIPVHEFSTYAELIDKKDYELLTRRFQKNQIALDELIENMNLSNSKLEDGFNDLSNSVYLPLIGNSPSVTSLKNLKIKPQNYIQLVLKDDSPVSTEFLSSYFNSKIGIKLRESISSGTTIRRISKGLLQEALLFLPDPKNREKIVEIEKTISQLELKISEYKRKTWDKPDEISKIFKEVKRMNKTDHFSEWMESLPFPLGSILYIYRIKQEKDKKLRNLLNFFEAAAQFTTTIILSALVKEKKRLGLVEIQEKTKDKRFQRSNFGDWVNLGEKLSKTARRFLSSEKQDDREFYNSLFGNINRRFLTMITNKKVYSILAHANQIRNKEFHGGISNEYWVNEQLTQLERLLLEFQEVISDNFEDVILVYPQKAEFDEVFNYEVKRIMGTRSPFIVEDLITTNPMQKDQLHLVDINQKVPLTLLPFFQLRESPKSDKNACYFFNRIQGNQVHWKSFHFDSQPELEEPNGSLKEYVTVLQQFDDLKIP